MTFVKYRTQTFTFNEFRELELYKEIKKVDKLLEHLKRNKKAYTTLVMALAFVFFKGYISPSLAINPDEAISKINTIGNQLLKLVRVIGYWTVILVSSRDCIKEAMRGCNHNVMAIVSRGLIIMAVLYFLPELFSMMESLIE